MNPLSLLVASAAACALVAGLLGMASAEPHLDAHSTHPTGVVGVDVNLRDRQTGVLRLGTLRGEVNDAWELTISDRRVKSGRYKIVVSDTTTMHNWHITGRGVDKETSVRGTGTWTWKVRLRDGKYRVVCDPHKRSMSFTIRVR
jgi:hypothetical protein